MSKAGDAINRARTKVAAKGDKPFFDLCDLLPAPTLTAQGAGHTMTAPAAIANIPCSHRQLGGGGVQVIDETGTAVTKSHRITLPYTSTTVLIDRHYKIRVHARGLNAETIFEQPVREFSSTSPLLSVLATVTEGQRSPGIL